MVVYMYIKQSEHSGLYIVFFFFKSIQHALGTADEIPGERIDDVHILGPFHC